MLRSVTNALRAVEVLAAADRPVGVTEVAATLGVAPSTAHRLLATLVAAGFARREPDRRYWAGPAIARFAARQALPPLLRDAARPVLGWLAEASGETVHLAVLDGISVVTIDHAAGTRPGDVAHVVGAHVPAHATAVGLALLAHHAEVTEALIASGLDRWTASTIVHAAELRLRLEEVRRRGYATNVRGWIEGTSGIAAPVLLSSGDAVASVGISGSAERVGRSASITALVPLARAGALAIARRLETAVPEHPLGD